MKASIMKSLKVLVFLLSLGSSLTVFGSGNLNDPHADQIMR